MIGGIAAGINFREGKAGTDFVDNNPFIPHIVKAKNRFVNLDYKISYAQKNLIDLIEFYDIY